MVADKSSKLPEGPPVYVQLWKRFRQSPVSNAGDVLGYLGFRAPPIDPFWIARHLGINIYTSADPVKQGEWGVDTEGTPFLFVNPNDSPQTQRFTIAHELGHVLLGHPPDRRGSHPEDALETQADRFAAELLMPSHWVSSYNHSANRLPLAKIFDVPEQLLQTRLSHLGF